MLELTRFAESRKTNRRNIVRKNQELIDYSFGHLAELRIYITALHKASGEWKNVKWEFSEIDANSMGLKFRYMPFALPLVEFQKSSPFFVQTRQFRNFRLFNYLLLLRIFQREKIRMSHRTDVVCNLFFSPTDEKHIVRSSRTISHFVCCKRQ